MNYSMKSKPESVWATQKLWRWKNTTVMITESAGVAEQKNSLVYAHFSVFLWRRAPQNRCGYLHVSRNYTACSCLPQPWTWSIPTQCPQYVPWDASNVLLGVMATDLMNRFLHHTGKVRSWAWSGAALQHLPENVWLLALSGELLPQAREFVEVSFGAASVMQALYRTVGGEFTSMSKFQLSPMAMSSR